MLRVLTYNAFMSAWGPGPELGKKFEAETGIHVEFVGASDAGLLLKKLELFPADVTLGFDRLLLAEARLARSWRSLPADLTGQAVDFGPDFSAIDWAPLAFVYREGEIEPPRSLADLEAPRFQATIALEDPRTSTPGLQFFFWVLDSLGEEKGFEFLARLKSNVHSVSGSWSTAYGFFTHHQATLVFSYLTSPVYHWVNDHDPAYRAAVFSSGHPIQVEMGAIPTSCVQCDAAVQWLRFLRQKESQRLIMNKNYMLPVTAGVDQGEFARLPKVDSYEADRFTKLAARKSELLGRWQDLGL